MLFSRVLADNAGRICPTPRPIILHPRLEHQRPAQLAREDIADTSNGLSIGLINIVHHGMHELSVYSDEWSSLNVAFRSGNPKGNLSYPV
jgi:hypothetical protein